MEKMVFVQHKLEKALLILAKDADIQKRHERVYNECLCHIVSDNIPRVLRKEYYQLMALATRHYSGVNHADNHSLLTVEEHHQDFAYELPDAILVLLKRLTEWMAIESYIYSQQHAIK
ncbi:hypothetical protein [Dryocola clanedunensis]